MKAHNVEQGTREWMQVRIGIPTGSRANDIVTPARLQPSASQTKYRNQLLAEWLLGYPVDWSDSSGWSERGRDMEDEARKWYEFERGCDVQRVGFVTRDDGLFGGSPDGLVGADGGVELKCPALHTHVGYLLDPASLVAEYRGQVQCYMHLTGRDWWDVVSYNPELPPVVERVTPDAKYLAAFLPALDTFIADLIAKRERLAPHKMPAMQEAA